MAAVLAQIEGGPAVLSALRQAREEIARSNAKSRSAAEIVVRRFGLQAASRPLLAVLDFIAAWEEKAITRTKELAELLEYLEYFREAGGAIPMTAPREADAVALMTAHTAKGPGMGSRFHPACDFQFFPLLLSGRRCLNFPPICAKTTPSRSSDGPTLHEQEERRLFYVAMTRARDSLAMYAQQGRGKSDPTPPGYLRELLANSGIRQWFRRREAQAFAGDLFAEAEAEVAAALPLASRVSQWLKELAGNRKEN